MSDVDKDNSTVVITVGWVHHCKLTLCNRPRKRNCQPQIFEQQKVVLIQDSIESGQIVVAMVTRHNTKQLHIYQCALQLLYCTCVHITARLVDTSGHHMPEH